MKREETERMAEGIVRLRDEILRRREPDAEGGAVELTPAQGGRCARWCGSGRSGSGRSPRPWA
jgi:hypothetical protein